MKALSAQCNVDSETVFALSFLLFLDWLLARTDEGKNRTMAR